MDERVMLMWISKVLEPYVQWTLNAMNGMSHDIVFNAWRHGRYTWFSTTAPPAIENNWTTRTVVIPAAIKERSPSIATGSSNYKKQHSLLLHLQHSVVLTTRSSILFFSIFNTVFVPAAIVNKHATVPSIKSDAVLLSLFLALYCA